MRNVTKDNITDVFKSYMAADMPPRTRELLEGLVEHMHDFAREKNLTHEEWRQGIAFLEGCAAIETEDRHEFVLASDVLGLSSLVDMLHSDPASTSSSVLGPFHVSGAPPLAVGGDMKHDFGGPILLAEGVIRDTDGNPIPNAEIDIWQTAPNGLYASQDDDQDTFSFHGVMKVGADGRYAFTTAKPAEYTVPSDGPVGAILNACGRHPWRPSHLHYIVKAEGFRTLVTEVFPEDDPYLDQDTVFGVRDDLVMRYVEKRADEFPDGMALSGKVQERFLHVNFDVTLAQD
ncbi:dioxygenase [Falsihalocynthiibacter arcticus]|uniref:Hydroxyquinol 1,2-dioxygenase n=1 Tax=Falsihalocynthiibacter arcticus TaxID=1579316 RepID=A0A126V0M2_9RHOB|nr:dioxygenase [Falsihalocynthiibacter arcticus]AML51881.1 hydroxyquinol 1,2-dioxygenase [Falsihalocynthiibacter arcticus]